MTKTQSRSRSDRSNPVTLGHHDDVIRAQFAAGTALHSIDLEQFGCSLKTLIRRRCALGLNQRRGPALHSVTLGHHDKTILAMRARGLHSLKIAMELYAEMDMKVSEPVVQNRLNALDREAVA